MTTTTLMHLPMHEEVNGNAYFARHFNMFGNTKDEQLCATLDYRLAHAKELQEESDRYYKELGLLT